MLVLKLNFRMTRREFYELVWSHPPQELGERFGRPASAVRTLCKRFEVPIPPAMYWRSDREGRKLIAKEPLKPSWADAVDIQFPAPGKEKKDASRLTIRRGSARKLRVIEPPIKIPTERPAVLHPAIWNKDSWQPPLEGPYFVAVRPFHINATRPLIKRALFLSHALFYRLEDRGHEIVETDRGVRVKIGLEEFEFAFNERGTMHASPVEDWRLFLVGPADKFTLEDTLPLQEWCRTNYRWPTGRLTMHITSRGWSQRLDRSWTDQSSVRVEDYAADIILTMEEHSAYAGQRKSIRDEAQRKTHDARGRTRRVQFIEDGASLLARRDSYARFLDHLGCLASSLSDTEFQPLMEDVRLAIKNLDTELDPQRLKSTYAALDVLPET